MQNRITKVNYYACGYCTNGVHHIFKKVPREKRHFPAGVFLMEHPSQGLILFDTGYALSMMQCGFRGKLYHLLNPTVVHPEDLIESQLERDGIGTDDIRYVILSHLHPDHIGGVKAFLKAKFILSKRAYHRYQKAGMKDLILKQLLPSWFEDRLMLISQEQLASTKTPYFKAYDLFGDGSLLLMSIEGHGRGQIGAFINKELFLGADSSWGVDYLDLAPQMKWMATLVQDDFKSYLKTTQVLKKMQADGIGLIFSHDLGIDKEVLYVK